MMPNFANLDVLRNMQPRMRPVAPYQSPGGQSMPPLQMNPIGGQPPGINPVGPYPVGPIAMPGVPMPAPGGPPGGIPMPVRGGPMRSPAGAEGNMPIAGGPMQSPLGMEGGLPNLMALRSMMQRTPYRAY